MNLYDNHWVLCVIIPAKAKVHYYDPIAPGTEFEIVTQDVIRCLHQIDNSINWATINKTPTSSLQEDGSNCRVYVCMLMEALKLGAENDFLAQLRGKGDDYRIKMAARFMSDNTELP